MAASWPWATWPRPNWAFEDPPLHRLSNLQLFTVCVLIWSTTWHAIVYQIAEVAPEWSVALRFSLAGLVVLAGCRWHGLRLRFTPRAHALFALQGVFMYSLSYICVYHAELHVPSGLVAVGYSASPLLSGLGAWLLWRSPLPARFVAGGVAGVLGVALIFWPEFGQVGAAAMLGAAFTAAAVLLATVGGLLVHAGTRRDTPFWLSLGYTLFYSSLCSAALAGLSGVPLTLPSTLQFWGSLAYLVLAGTVVAFACWLTLQQRLGPGKAGTVGVATPVLALLVSAALEGYRPDVLTGLGAALAMVGNVLMLRSRSPSLAS